MSHTASYGFLAPQAQPSVTGLSKQQQDVGKLGARTLVDLTNNGAQQREFTKASAGLSHCGSQSLSAAFRPSLANEVFADARLIDGHRWGDAGSLQTEVDKKRARRQDWVDMDAQNHDDPQAVSHYAMAIFEYLKESELTRRPNANYLDQQTEINIKMRSILVDWLVEVAEEYKLCADTLYLAVNFLDRFLSISKVQRAHLQLAGVTCMWLAAKFEEIYPPNVSEFAYITDNTYTREQLVAMEEQVLKKLKYELAVPTAKTFLRRLLQVCNPDDNLHFLSNYLTELSLIDNNMLHFLPSEIAASAVYLSNLLLRRAPWSGTLQHYSYYTPQLLVRCVDSLANLHILVSQRAGQGELTAMTDKYAHGKYLSVSRSITPLPAHFVQAHLNTVADQGPAISVNSAYSST